MLTAKFIPVVYLLALMTPFSAGALTLTQGWFMALDNDPQYRAAVKDQLAGEEYIPIGRAGLLPKVSVSYQRAPRNWQRQQYQQTNLLGERSEVVQHQQYDSYSGSVTVVQPLFDYDAYAGYRIGIIKKMQSDERYRSSLIDLQNRLITAWLDLTEAHQRLQLATLHRQGLEEQKKQAQRQFEAGEGAVTDVTETASALSLAIADEVEARDTLDTANVALSAIVGMDLSQTAALPILGEKPLKLPLASGDYRYWEQKAAAHNPDILSAGHSVEEKRYEIERSRAGALPRVQLYAMHSENDSSNDNTIHQKYRTDSIGLRVSMDLFSGGGVSASLRQAAARYEQAKYLHDAQRLATYSEIKKSLNKCLHASERLAAYASAVDAARRQIVATKKSIQAGQRMNIDLLNAEQSFYKTKVELTAEKHAVIKAWVSLLAQTGEINNDNVMLLDSYFAQ
ncbi:TolC family outer membrane protein [Enterobacter cloacae]|uniref:TolC family outer membrane protein n=1 Tax=Enterobacter cloacae TaxID=550 RepID=UPI0032DADF2B